MPPKAMPDSPVPTVFDGETDIFFGEGMTFCGLGTRVAGVMEEGAWSS